MAEAVLTGIEVKQVFIHLSKCPTCKQNSVYKRTAAFRSRENNRPLKDNAYHMLKLECRTPKCHFSRIATSGIEPK